MTEALVHYHCLWASSHHRVTPDTVMSQHTCTVHTKDDDVATGYCRVSYEGLHVPHSHTALSKHDNDHTAAIEHVYAALLMHVPLPCNAVLVLLPAHALRPAPYTPWKRALTCSLLAVMLFLLLFLLSLFLFFFSWLLLLLVLLLLLLYVCDLWLLTTCFLCNSNFFFLSFC